jgi:hypothetical protein
MNFRLPDLAVLIFHRGDAFHFAPVAAAKPTVQVVTDINTRPLGDSHNIGDVANSFVFRDKTFPLT